MRLADKVAIITGAGSGIGKASAYLFAKEGAKVAVADIDDAGGAETAANIRTEGGEAVFVHTDVSIVSEVKNLVKITKGKYGKIDVLYNNASIFMKPTAIEDIDESFWDRMYAVNVKGTFLMTKYVVPEMKKVKSGVIINTSSIAVNRPTANGCLYTSTKGAVLLLTKVLAKEFAPYNIRVNCICPGGTDTPMLDLFPEEIRENLVNGIPLGRLNQPEDIAKSALFLASDEAAMITGAHFIVDGGQGI